MKILYLGFDRSDAALAAHALHASVGDASVTWAQTPDSAMEWLTANPDTAGIIVQVQAQSCAPFIEQLRAGGWDTPVTVVDGSPHLDAALATLNAGADGYVPVGPSLDTDLPRSLALAMGRARARVDARRAAGLAEARVAAIEAQSVASRARDAKIAVGLQERLLEFERALQIADERRASDVAALSDQLARRHAEFTAALAQSTETRDVLAVRLAAAVATLEETREAREADAVAAAERLCRHEAELGTALAESGAARAVLQTALADANAAYHEERQRADRDRGAADERQAALEDLLTEEADALRHLRQRLAAVEAAYREADERHAVELTDAAAQMADIQAGHAADRQEDALARAALERELADTCTDADRSRHRLLHALASHRRRNLDRQLQLQAQLAGERSAADRAQRAALDEVRQLQLEGETLRRLLMSTQERAQELGDTLTLERQAHSRTRLVGQSELQRAATEHAQLRQSFDELQSAFRTLEQTTGAHVAERARIEALLADRDRELIVHAERQRLVEQEAHVAIGQLQDRLCREQEASRSEIGRLESGMAALGVELNASRARAEALRQDAERVPDLQAHLEVSRKERRRDFERAPYALCRCTPEGLITEANHSFLAILGRRRADEVWNRRFTDTVLECAGDLGWLLDRARSTRRTETIETGWAPGDGRHLVVRLQALAASTGSIDIVVEDVTEVRALEERLRRAQQMEAVGRLASEVATRCDALLGDVIRDANDCVAAFHEHDGLRNRGERLVTDAVQVAAYLRQLAVYGDSQARTVEPVSAQRILQDLAPVLKRVVGDRIELTLSKSAGSFEVDVAAERLERILVNVAGYARQRMPAGGEMRIDLSTTAVGRRFVARHPHVRPGDHVLITVTELAQAASTSDVERASVSLDKAGVDLGALVELIGTCGGHLWMEAQPAGNIVVKIHLPKRGGAPDARTERPGRLARWFRSPSATVARA
ncbi:MAG TPA: hypothetical protein VGI12_20000 [Vicinamibacterales bacterium]|jgi:hypothetical protein